MAAFTPCRHRRYPKVRPLIRAANVVGAALRRSGAPVAELADERLLQLARRQTGLQDLGDERFRRPLRLLLESYATDPELTFVGRLVARRMMVHLVANRQRVHRDLATHPEVLSAEVRRPLFIVGLPRSGTTLLYNLLAQDGAHRPLLFWETMSPSPPPKWETRHSDPRIDRAARTVARLHRVAPNLQAIHPLDPRGPDECLGLLMNTFVTPFFRGRVPRYRAWLYALSDAEVATAYGEYRQQLLLLQRHIKTDRWLLKCPSHLFGLKALLGVFSDAAVVQTHRDPVRAVPSLCSLTATLDGLSYRRVDWHEVGRRNAQIVEQLIRRALQAREEGDSDRVCDVHYRQLVADPVAVVRRIYHHFGFDYGAAMDGKLKAYLAKNPQHKHGVHRYELEDFGLDRAVLSARFAAYCQRFQVEPE